jgi:hypothetical protein
MAERACLTFFPAPRLIVFFTADDRSVISAAPEIAKLSICLL